MLNLRQCGLNAFGAGIKGASKLGGNSESYLKWAKIKSDELVKKEVTRAVIPVNAGLSIDKPSSVLLMAWAGNPAIVALPIFALVKC